MSAAPGFSPVTELAINSVFANFMQNFGLGAPQSGNSTAQSAPSNPFIFSSFTPQFNFSIPQTNGGGNWFDNFMSSLSPGGPSMQWNMPSAGTSNNVGSINVPSYVSQNNKDKIFGSAGKPGLNTEMQARIIELMKRYYAKTGKTFEIKEAFCSDEVRTARKDAAREKNDGSIKFYADGISQHSLGNAIDINRQTTSREECDVIQHIWKYEMGSTIGMDFYAKKTREPLNEFWHCDGRKDISRQSKVAQWTSGSPSAVADNGGGSSSGTSGGGFNPWGGGFSFTFPTSFNGFGGGNNLLNSLLGGLGGLGNFGGLSPNMNNAGGSKTKALKSAYTPMIESIVGQYGQYGNDAKFMSCLIEHESSFNPNIVSPAGAKGLTQLMDFNLKKYGVTNPFDPEQSIMGGTKMMNDLLKKYNGNRKLALVAYRSGGGYVDKMIRQYGNSFEAIAPYLTPGARGYAIAITDRYENAPVSSTAYV